MADWLTTQNNERVVELLEDQPDVYSPESALWKLKTLYSSCLDDYANLRSAGKRMAKLIGERQRLHGFVCLLLIRVYGARQLPMLYCATKRYTAHERYERYYSG